MNLRKRGIVILAEGTLDFHHGKTAVSILRYRSADVAAVVDSENAGRTVEDVLEFGGAIPIVASIEDALRFEATELLIGIAPRGGSLPVEWRRQILTAMRNGLDIVSGLHYMLAEDEEFATTAAEHGVKLFDVRRPPANLSVADLRPRRQGTHVLSFVGTDCAVGKMTAALELHATAQRRGLNTAFVATGQTGIMLEGDGIAIDRVIGDFMAGAAEQLVLAASEQADWVFVEGQGSIFHPAYSGVTLALLHGASPDAMILVHPPGHDQIDEYPVRIPPLDTVIQMYEMAAAWVRPAPVVAIALNTRAHSDTEARNEIAKTEALTGLPADDPVRFGGDRLLDAVTNAR